MRNKKERSLQQTSLFYFDKEINSLLGVREFIKGVMKKHIYCSGCLCFTVLILYHKTEKME